MLVFDTDSEDEEDDYQISRRPMVVTPTSSPSSGSRRPIVVEDDEDDDSNEDCDSNGDETRKQGEDAVTTLTKSQKKNKRNRKKRKKKLSKSSSSMSEEQTQETKAFKKAASVSFSTVQVRTYARCFSADTVPADGGWPLGMELDHYENAEEVSVEEYQNQKQEDLKERWENLAQNITDEKILENMKKRPDDGTPLLLETRQWDYRTGIKNPLFGALSEEQRQNLFVPTSDNSTPSNPPSPSKRRNRSNSECFNEGRRRTRSNSECFNEEYNQVYVHHVRNELEQIRNDRTKSGATGCNCRKLTVYIPPKDGSGGKRAQHRRMKPSRLSQELKKRGLYDPKASRETLERILYKAVAKEPCCRGDDCFCSRNGIDCQADSCSCWHDSHVHTKSTGNGYLDVHEIQARCGNPLGMATVDIATIDNFRTDILESQICQPVGCI